MILEIPIGNDLTGITIFSILAILYVISISR